MEWREGEGRDDDAKKGRRAGDFEGDLWLNLGAKERDEGYGYLGMRMDQTALHRVMSITDSY